MHDQSTTDAEEEDLAALESDRLEEEQPLYFKELAPRRRRRALSPLTLGLLAVLLSTGGFIIGVLVEKGQQSSGGDGSFARGSSPLAALRTASRRGPGGPVLGAGGATVGQVSYLSGRTLYVLDAEGNTLRVNTSSASQVTKTVSTRVDSIRPGETVIVTGPANKAGAIDAQTIRVGGPLGAGTTALFGGGAGQASDKGSGGPVLFGG